MLPIQIIATGKALPNNRISSSELDIRLGKPTGYVEKHSGIEYRYHANDTDSQADLAVVAIKDALTRGKIKADSIDLLINASAISVQALPCSAIHILKRADLRKGIPGFDINASCVSFIIALQTAALFLSTNSYQRIAIVTSELASRGLNWDDEDSSLIFGDGAACIIVEKGDGQKGIIAYHVESYPEGSELCEIRAGGTRKNPRSGVDNNDFLFKMDGKGLYKLTTQVIDGFLNNLFKTCPITMADIDNVIPHQASHLALLHMSKRLGITDEKLINIYRQHGNQVAASLPTALHETIMMNRFISGSTNLLMGTAAGLTLAAMVLIA